MESLIFVSVTTVQEDVIIQAGQYLWDIYKEKSVTLRELPDAAGVTMGLLSQIKSSRTISSLNVLLSLIKSLEINLDEFFSSIDGRDGQQKVIVQKMENYLPFGKENTKGFTCRRLFSTQVQDYHLDFVSLTLSTHGARPALHTEAFEFDYVLKGEEEYLIGDEFYVLGEGIPSFLVQDS